MPSQVDPRTPDPAALEPLSGPIAHAAGPRLGGPQVACAGVGGGVKAGAAGPAQPPPPGLVHTETSRTRTSAEWQALRGAWAAWELQRRLSRMRRRTITRSRLQAEEVQGNHLVHLVTFTYAPGHEWTPKHIAQCLMSYRKQAARDGVPWRYEWVAELQLNRMRRRRESAAQCMHYHAIIWQPEGYQFPYPDARGWWTHGMTNVDVARNPVGYLAKYASKGTEGERLPRGARISGGGGLSAEGRKLACWWLRPRYVREAFPDFMHSVRRAPGGGWLNLESGELVEASEDQRALWKSAPSC